MSLVFLKNCSYKKVYKHYIGSITALLCLPHMFLAQHKRFQTNIWWNPTTTKP